MTGRYKRKLEDKQSGGKRDKKRTEKQETEMYGQIKDEDNSGVTEGKEKSLVVREHTGVKKRRARKQWTEE